MNARISRISRFAPVLLASLAVFAVGCSALSTSSGPTAAPQGGGTVTATPQGGPSSTAPQGGPSSATPQGGGVGTTAPGGPAGAPACTTAQLALGQLGGGLVNGSKDIYYLYFMNRTMTACTVLGYPVVSAVTEPDASATEIGSAALQSAAEPAAPVLLRPGQVAQVTLDFSRTGNFASPACRHVNVQYLKIVAPGVTTAAYMGIDEQVCAAVTLPTMTITALVHDPAQ